MRCKACKCEILDSEPYLQATLVPEEMEDEGYRKFGCAPVLLYCTHCSDKMRRYIFEIYNGKK